MFTDHQSVIADYAQRHPDNLARVLKFVVLTIRTRLIDVPGDMETLDAVERGALRPDIDGILYGSKNQAVQHINAEKVALYEQAQYINFASDSERHKAESLLGLFASIPGIGLAKSGFCAQLAFGVSACLDSHNLERFNISPNVIKSSTFKAIKRASTRQKWLERYCGLVEQFGGTESLWDSWCIYVANRADPVGFKMNGNLAVYESPNHVSELHCSALGL